MVKQVQDDAAFEGFSQSLFRLTRALRATTHLWVQLPGGLKRTDVSILTVLADLGDARPGVIADRLNVGASVISRQIVSLQELGLVLRRRDPDDGRAELLSLTDEGRDRLLTLRAAYITGMREQFTDWDGDKVERATTLLDEIADHIIPALGGHDRSPTAVPTVPAAADAPTDTDTSKDLYV